MWNYNDSRLKGTINLSEERKARKFFGMTENEAYNDYVAFCRENNIKAGTKEEFLAFMGIAEEELGDLGDNGNS